MEDLFDFVAKPRSAWLTVNRACNFRCKWCYGQNTSFNPRETMPLDKAKQIVQIAKDCGVEAINIIGGEPTIWEHLWELISFCKKQDVKVGIITNAYRFSDDDFWEKYKRNPCDYVGVSLKSGNPESFLLATGVDLYEQTMIGVQRAFSFHNCGFSTVYNSLVGADGLVEIAQKCKRMGASSITVSLCSAIMDGEEFTNCYSVELSKMVDDIVKVYPLIETLYDGKVEFELFIPLCLFPKQFIQMLYDKEQIVSICHVHDRTGIVFDTNGDVLPCNTMIGNPILKYNTDYKDGSSLMEFLNSKTMIEEYRELLRYPSRECSLCSFNRRCKGGCIINWTFLDPSICKSIDL